MSRGYASVFAGFVTLCLGLIAASSIPIGLSTAVNLAFGETLSADQVGLVELVLMAITVLLTVVFVTDGVISGLRGRGDTTDEAKSTASVDDDWMERFIGR
jgi:hypothetical protein